MYFNPKELANKINAFEESYHDFLHNDSFYGVKIRLPKAHFIGVINSAASKLIYCHKSRACGNNGSNVVFDKAITIKDSKLSIGEFKIIGINQFDFPDDKEVYFLCKTRNERTHLRMIPLDELLHNVPYDKFKVITKTLINELKHKLAFSWNWILNDFISFIQAYNINCEIVSNKDNCLLIKMNDFNSLYKCFGEERCHWCITRSEHWFERYTTDSLYECGTIYVLLNFNLKIDDGLSCVAFTHTKESGVTNVHDMRNNHHKGIINYTIEQLQKIGFC